MQIEFAAKNTSNVKLVYLIWNSYKSTNVDVIPKSIIYLIGNYYFLIKSKKELM